MDIIEFANTASKHEIDLGTNPIRTIRYYISIGILGKPEIVQAGKKRISQFNDELLIQLKIINHLKKQGMSLHEIKDKINGMIFWSDDALKLIENYRDQIPEDAYRRDKPITRREMAFFLAKILDENRSHLNKEDIKKYFVDKDNNPLEIPFE